MFKRNEKYYALLAPYLEGDLDDVRAADLRARLAEDTALAAEAERLRRTLSSLRETSRRTPAPENAAVPADLWPRLRDRLQPAPAPRRAAPAGWLAAVGAAAAVAFAALWLPVGQPREPARVAKSPRPSSATKGPERMASAPKSEGLRLSAPVLTVPVPHVPAAPAPATRQPLPAVTVKPPLSGHDPFAAANAAGARAGAKAAAPLIVPAPLGVPGRVAAMPPAGPPKKQGPTMMAAGESYLANGDRVAGDARRALPRYDSPTAVLPAPTTLDRLTTPPPAAPAAPAPPLAASSTAADAATQPRTDAPAFTAGVPALAPPASDAFRARGFAAEKTKAAPAVNSPQNVYANTSLLKPRTNARAGALGGLQQFVIADPKQTLDSWQASLAQAVQPPLLGQDAGAQQANQALMSARQSGSLDTLRERLEARRAQSPRDLTTARMLAAVYDFAFSTEAALRERRRLVTLDGATGEDWYALAEAEGHVGNGQAARAAYRRSLSAPGPLSGFHAQIAKGRG